jgi:hypothetical protein
MSLCVQKHLPLFQVIVEANSRLRTLILKAVDKNFVEAITECCLNFLRGNIDLEATRLKKLLKYKLQIRTLGSLKTSLKTKKLILKKSSVFLPVILTPIIKGLPEYIERNNETCTKNGVSRC